MRGWLLVAMLILTLSGCAAGSDCPEDGCLTAHPETLGRWEASLDGQDWVDPAAEALVIEVQTMDLAETAGPTPLGGGGQLLVVDPVRVPAVHVRLPDLPSGAVRVVFGTTPEPSFYDPASDPFIRLGETAPGDAFVWAPDLEADPRLAAHVLDADRRIIAHSWQSLHVPLVAHLAFQGQVHPLSPPDTFPLPAPDWPTDVDDMSDRFSFGAWANAYGWIGARTSLREGDPQAVGTDLGLELLDGDGGFVACSEDDSAFLGEGEADEVVDGRLPLSRDAGLEQAAELRVGHPRAPACAPTGYSNPAPVAYRLDVWLAVDWLNAPRHFLVEDLP